MSVVGVTHGAYCNNQWKKIMLYANLYEQVA